MKIVFVGKAKAGRSMASLYLARKHDFKEIGLEDGVKRIMQHYFYPEEHRKAQWQLRMRIYDALYKIDNDVFIRYVVKRIRDGRRRKVHIVIDDVRYINELKVLVDMGFTVVRLVAPESRRQGFAVLMKDAAVGSVIINEWFNKDATEPYKADFVIINSDRYATYRSLDQLVEKLAAEEEKLDIKTTEPLNLK